MTDFLPLTVKTPLGQVTLRPETLADVQPIADLTTAAFSGKPYSDGTEAALIDALRREGVLALSLVAEGAGQRLGHVALSPAEPVTDSGRWFALGPIAVAPSAQGKGIGAALIRAAQSWMAGQGALGCILIGSTGYYPRFGFLPRPDLAPEGEPAAHFMVWKCTASAPDVVIRFHPALQSSKVTP